MAQKDYLDIRCANHTAFTKLSMELGQQGYSFYGNYPTDPRIYQEMLRHDEVFHTSLLLMNIHRHPRFKNLVEEKSWFYAHKGCKVIRTTAYVSGERTENLVAFFVLDPKKNLALLDDAPE
jgi:hypothetical protein